MNVAPLNPLRPLPAVAFNSPTAGKIICHALSIHHRVAEMTPINPPPFAALLLAGGRSRRMGQDKALLEWCGRPLWRVQVEKLLKLGPAHTLVACRAEQGLENYGTPVGGITFLPDPPGEDLGPIAAIARALEQTELPVLALAVDAPLLTGEFLRDHVLVHLHSEHGCFHRSAHGLEPFPGIYTPEMLPILLGAIRQNQLSLQRLIEAAAAQDLAHIHPLDPEFEPLFQNANTPEEWAQSLS